MILAALRFNEKINEQDLEGLTEMMTENHRFIDSDGKATQGKEVIVEGWRVFFEKYPDYRNAFTCVTLQNDVVVMVGYSSCSYKLLDGPNIWTARIHGDRVSEWRVYWLNER